MLVGQQIGPFEIEKELGSGAMGTVYRAKFQRTPDKVVPVALKVVALALVGNEAAMARFEREANILKQLKHPHIVRLIAHGRIHRRNPYIAMEYIDGDALDRILARRGKLSWEEVLSYGKQLCEALQYAHDKGIIHRDLKPSNLMLTREGSLKLTDFGIAKDTDVTALTGANSTIGTAAYMSPEQCKGDRNLSNKSDLYSLGIVFFELLSGRKPFMAENTVDMFMKHVNDPPPRIGKLVNDLPGKFEALILQLLEKQTDDRPIDAAWVGRMLGDIEEDAFARKSAGLALAQSRGLKPRNLDGDRLDESDKEAARALRGKKKKKKKADVPFLERKWVQALGIGVVLMLLALGGYLALRPPGPEKLYAEIDKSETPEGKFEAASKFLAAHGSRGGDLVDRVAEKFRAAAVKLREKQLTNRFLANLAKPTESDDPEAYSAAWDAMAAEKAGDWDRAGAAWTKVKGRFPDEGELPFSTDDSVLARARWGWVATKRLGDIETARSELVRLRQKIDAARPNELALKTDWTNPESVAIRALRLRAFGDQDRALRVSDTLITMVEKDSEQHVWFLLGCQMRSGLARSTDDPVEARIKRLEKWLASVEKEAAGLRTETELGAERREVRNKCRDVIELYDDDSDPQVQGAVKRASQIAALVPK